MMLLQRMSFADIVGCFVLFTIIFAAFFGFVESFMVRTIGSFCLGAGSICVTVTASIAVAIFIIVTASITVAGPMAVSMSMSHDRHG